MRNVPRRSRLGALIALLGLSCGLYQCHTTTVMPPAPGAGLAGSWRLTSLTASPETTFGADLYQYFTGRVPCFAEIRYAFNADGTVAAQIPGTCPLDGEDLQDSVGFDTRSSWSLDGDRLTITSSDGLREQYDLQLAGTSMKLVFQNETSLAHTYTATFVRQ